MAGTFEEIEAFARVVESGSFAAAASALGLSASVVTRRVQALEARLAVQLLQRTTRRVALTEAGQLFHDRVARIPALLGEATEAVRDLGTGVAGQLRVIMPSSFASSGFHHQVIPRFLREHPAVHLTLRVVTDPLAHLREDFDLLVAARGPGLRFPDTSHVRRPRQRGRGPRCLTRESDTHARKRSTKAPPHKVALDMQVLHICANLANTVNQHRATWMHAWPV